jgi:ATP-dependent exoDNAse (exonuclease V) beta subunit
MIPAAYKKPQILRDPALHRGHVLIEASAGTGKTYTIEHLVLDLVISGRASIEQILVVTFTDAATRELRERIRNLIQAVCDAPQHCQREPTAAITGWSMMKADRGCVKLYSVLTERRFQPFTDSATGC